MGGCEVARGIRLFDLHEHVDGRGVKVFVVVELSVLLLMLHVLWRLVVVVHLLLVLLHEVLFLLEKLMLLLVLLLHEIKEIARLLWLLSHHTRCWKTQKTVVVDVFVVEVIIIVVVEIIIIIFEVVVSVDKRFLVSEVGVLVFVEVVQFLQTLLTQLCNTTKNMKPQLHCIALG